MCDLLVDTMHERFNIFIKVLYKHSFYYSHTLAWQLRSNYVTAPNYSLLKLNSRKLDFHFNNSIVFTLIVFLLHGDNVVKYIITANLLKDVVFRMMKFYVSKYLLILEFSTKFQFPVISLLLFIVS